MPLREQERKRTGQQERYERVVDETLLLLAKLAQVIEQVDPTDVGARLGATPRPNPTETAEWLDTVYSYADYLSGNGSEDTWLEADATRRANGGGGWSTALPAEDVVPGFEDDADE